MPGGWRRRGRLAQGPNPGCGRCTDYRDQPRNCPWRLLNWRILARSGWFGAPTGKATWWGTRLVYAATGDGELSRRLFEEARRLNILINVADAPDFCSFIVPSVIRRGRLQVAISTEGASPALARSLRQRMESWLGDEVEVLLEVMAAARDWLKHHEPDAAVRGRKLNALAASDLGDALRHGDVEAAEGIVVQCLGGAVSLADLGVQPLAISSKTRPGDGA